MLLSSVDVKDCDHLQISQFQSSTMKFAGLQMIPSDKMVRCNDISFYSTFQDQKAETANAHRKAGLREVL